MRKIIQMQNVNQQTLVIIKPDGVRRQLVGEIISRFEHVGLRLVQMKLITPTVEHSKNHYADDEGWYKSVGDRMVQFFTENGQNLKEGLGTDDPIEIGKLVREWLATYLSSDRVIAMVLEGPHAIEIVRKIVGSTYPLSAAPGTIRGDYSYESPFLANVGKRAIENLIHASGNPEEAKREIDLWFPKEK